MIPSNHVLSTWLTSHFSTELGKVILYCIIVNLHRSALSSALPAIEGFPVGKNPNMVIRLLKGDIYSTESKTPKHLERFFASFGLFIFNSRKRSAFFIIIESTNYFASCTCDSATYADSQSFRYLINCMHVSVERAVFQVVNDLKTTTPKGVLQNRRLNFRLFLLLRNKWCVYKHSKNNLYQSCQVSSRRARWN